MPRLRVAATLLRCSPNGGRAELAHPCAQTGGACSAIRLRGSAACNGAGRLAQHGPPGPCLWPARNLGHTRAQAKDGRTKGDPALLRAAEAGLTRPRARRACPTAGMPEFAPARARQCPAKGSRRDRMSRRPGRPAPMVLATFAETKVARSCSERKHFLRPRKARKLGPWKESGRRAEASALSCAQRVTSHPPL